MLARRAERLDTAWLMALSPMLVVLPADDAGAPAVGGLVTAASGLELRPRLVRLNGAADDLAAIQALGARPADILDLNGADDAAALAQLADWTSPVPPASLWAPWRGLAPRAFNLADRLADALPKAPVVFEYLSDAPASGAGVLPPDARAFALGPPSPALYLVLD